MSRISINREENSLFSTHSSTLKDTGARKKEVTAVERSSYCFRGFTFGVDSISEEVAGFSPFMVSPRKNTVFIVYCV